MKNTEIKHIDAKTLHDRLKAKSKLCLIDVREKDEWQTARIPQATLVPQAELCAKIKFLAPDLKTPIYLHCHLGGRSTRCAHQLAEMGYEEVYSIDGGISAWSDLGYPIES